MGNQGMVIMEYKNRICVFSIMNWKQLGYELFMRNSEGNIMGIYFMGILWEYYGSTIHEI
jgi:hypothetical protein